MGTGDRRRELLNKESYLFRCAPPLAVRFLFPLFCLCCFSFVPDLLRCRVVVGSCVGSRQRSEGEEGGGGGGGWRRKNKYLPAVPRRREEGRVERNRSRRFRGRKCVFFRKAKKNRMSRREAKASMWSE